jgi:enolase
MAALTIDRVHAWEALDSRGRPTVACRVELAGGGIGRAVAPSGASRGIHEAVEMRDGGARYGGFGVRKAVEAIREVLGPSITGRSAADREGIDDDLEALDGEPGFGRYGGNASLAVSLAITLAHADGEGTPLWAALSGSPRPLLPMPMVNILSGGAHAGGVIDIQDFLAVPIGAASFAEAIEWVALVRSECARLVDESGGWSALVADEGGLSARLPGNEAALRILADGIAAAGFAPGVDVGIAIDVAASQLTENGGVLLRSENAYFGAEQWVERLVSWVDRYPIVSIEDPLGEDEWGSWRHASERLSGIQLLGDDLFATNLQRLRRGISDQVANAVLIKVNQAGTVTKAERVLRAAQAAGMSPVVSARSGDTEDYWLADLAVGWRAGQIKVGSTMRSERTGKWNRLLEIEAEGDADYAGPSLLAPTQK